DCVSPPLKKAGFARAGRTWNRRRSVERLEKIDVVNLQGSLWNHGERGSFTVNLGVLLPEVYVMYWDKDPPKVVKEWQSQVRTRLGQLVDGRDTWYDLGPDVDLMVMGKAISDLLEHYAL